MADNKPSPIQHAARRFARDPAFFGHLFQQAGLEDAEIARRLDTDTGTVALLALCFQPRRQPREALKADLSAIAAHFRFDLLALLNLLREADLLAALRQAPAQGAATPPGLGLAARDKDEPQEADFDQPTPEEEPDAH